MRWAARARCWSWCARTTTRGPSRWTFSPTWPRRWCCTGASASQVRCAFVQGWHARESPCRAARVVRANSTQVAAATAAGARRLQGLAAAAVGDLARGHAHVGARVRVAVPGLRRRRVRRGDHGRQGAAAAPLRQDPSRCGTRRPAPSPICGCAASALTPSAPRFGLTLTSKLRRWRVGLACRLVGGRPDAGAPLERQHHVVQGRRRQLPHPRAVQARARGAALQRPAGRPARRPLPRHRGRRGQHQPVDAHAQVRRACAVGRDGKRRTLPWARWRAQGCAAPRAMDATAAAGC